MFSCKKDFSKKSKQKITAKDILGNPKYQAICYGGYRAKSRKKQPTIAQLKEDLQILHAMGFRIVRTYNVQPELPHAANVLKAIKELKQKDASFEMYVMLGAWINCLNAWSNLAPNHELESPDNKGEILRAMALAKQYPDIVKIISVGNEAMVKWATNYYVQPSVILKWVRFLQTEKKEGNLQKDLWITSSDDFASWGGGDTTYHTEDLKKLAHAVDYVSVHTYPYHNSHYNPNFWKIPESEQHLSDKEKVDKAMLRAKKFAVQQFDSVTNYLKNIGVNKPVHIGETGWASISNGYYGDNGSRASDEYKQSLYFKHIREWAAKQGVSCFYFEAFDEQWKDAENPSGSENHFGLINLKGEAKYVLWALVDSRVFKGLTRDGKKITKTYAGNVNAVMNNVLVPNVVHTNAQGYEK